MSTNEQLCPESLSSIISVIIPTPVGSYDVRCCDRGLHLLTLTPTTNKDKDENFVPDKSIRIETEAAEDSITDQDNRSGVSKPKKLKLSKSSEVLSLSKNWLQQYFESPEVVISLKSIEPPLCLPLKASTEFERKVWTTLAKTTPFGQVLSYAELAEKIGNPKASRAVGTALKKNPIAVIVPCHRVIRSDGTPGNYSGGTRNNVKQWLLDHEANSCDNSK